MAWRLTTSELTSLRGDVNGLITDKSNLAVNSVVIWGDSITNQNSQVVGNISNTVNAGYFIVGNILSNSFFTLLNNAGVSGERTDEILARFDTDVKPFNPEWIVLLAGANDLLSSIPLATIQTNLIALYDACESIGAKIITATQYASVSMPSPSDLGALNRFIKQTANERGHILADFEQVLTDPSSIAFPYTYADVTSDGLHINAYGAMLCGKELARVVAPYISKTVLLPSINDPKNKTVNPLNRGVGGTIDFGVAPDDWQTFISGGVPVGSSLLGAVTEVDGARIFTLTYTGTDEFTTFSRVVCDAPAAGKSYYGIAEINAQLSNSKEVSLKLRTLGGSAPKTGHANRTYADNFVVANVALDGVIKTPTIVNVDSTQLIIDIFITAESGFVEIGRVGVIELD